MKANQMWIYRTHFCKPWEVTENKYFPPPLLPVLLHHDLSLSSADWKAIFVLSLSSSHKMNGQCNTLYIRNCEASKSNTFLDNYWAIGKHILYILISVYGMCNSQDHSFSARKGFLTPPQLSYCRRTLLELRSSSWQARRGGNKKTACLNRFTSIPWMNSAAYWKYCRK